MRSIVPLLSLFAIGACDRGKDAVPPSPSPPAATASAAAAAPPPRLPVIEVKPEPTPFVTTSAAGARLGPKGWLWSRESGAKDEYEIVVSAAGAPGGPKITAPAPRPGIPHFFATPTRSFVWYEEHDRHPPQVFAIEGGRTRLVEGLLPSEWAFDLHDGRTLFVGTRGGRIMVASHWHLTIAGKEGPIEVVSAPGRESAWGAARLGEGFVVAVREPIEMAGATTPQKVSAVLGVLDGDGASAAALAEPARGALLFLDRDGHVTRREWIGPQRPAGLATTAQGWLVVLGEGTLARGLRDAVLVARAPGEAGFRVLLSDIETPGPLRARGDWSCFTEMPSRMRGEAYVVHCVDPVRGLHLRTPPLEGMVSVVDVEVGERPRAWLMRLRFRGEPKEEVLALALR